MSLIRQNYHEECEAAINQQINLKFYTSYVYLSMTYHFDRDDVAAKGYFNFCKHRSDTIRQQAMELMQYQNLRGGSIMLADVKAPAQLEWPLHVNVLEDALALEKELNKAFLSMHLIASNHKDAHLTNYLETKFLDAQVESINELSKFVTQANRCGKGLGQYQFEKNTMMKISN